MTYIYKTVAQPPKKRGRPDLDLNSRGKNDHDSDDKNKTEPLTDEGSLAPNAQPKTDFEKQMQMRQALVDWAIKQLNDHNTDYTYSDSSDATGKCNIFVADAYKK